jgi:hypothetical protein
VFPGQGGGYGFWFEFSSEGRVVMMADINNDCATEAYESSFRLEAVQRPSLFFDTYSYLHILSDPDPSVSGGVIGEGLQSDFEFAFEKVSDNGDTIRLKGNQNATPLVLIKATGDEARAFHNGDVSTVMGGAHAYAKAHQFVYIQSPDGKRVNTSINLDERLFALSLKQGDTLNIQSTPFAFTPYGLHLQKPVSYRTIAFQEVLFDTAEGRYYVIINGSRINLLDSGEPVLPLHLLLGVDFSALSVPPGGVEGSSAIFSSIVASIAGNLDGAALILSYIDLEFNTENRTMNLNIFFKPYGDDFVYVAQYPYAYEKSPDGMFKFQAYDEPNGNGEYLAQVVAPLLYYFDSFRFRMEYYKTENGYLSQMKCVESSQFYFAANFGLPVF